MRKNSGYFKIDDGVKDMKRFICLFLPVLLCVLSLCSCSGNTAADEDLSGRNNETVSDPGATERDETPLSDLSVYTAEYPLAVPYPENGDLAEQSQLDAWYKARRELRQTCYGAGVSLGPFFTRSVPAFLSGRPGVNSVCSPLNIYYSLAMLAEITGGDTRSQILSLLGAPDIGTLRKQANDVFNANYRNDGSAFCILADSLWMNESIEFNSDTLRTLTESYYASSFSGKPGSEDFDGAIRAWINSQTGDLLKDQVPSVKTDPMTLLAVYTTAYFGDKWQAVFPAEDTRRGVFRGPAGETEADFMKTTDLWGTYYRGEKFGAVKKDLRQDGTVWFILPDEGVSPEELLNDGGAVRFLFTADKDAGGQNAKSLRINLSVPKFDVSSDVSLSDSLKALGVTDCFEENADFTPLTDSKPAALSDIRHGARVVADEKGITAAAYTEMLVSGAAMPPEEEIDFILDRPFLFAVISDDGMPLFVGTVYQP